MGCCQHTVFELASLLWSQQQEQQLEECQRQCSPESGQQLKVGFIAFSFIETQEC
jgi:hypothetical protein